MRRHPWNGSLAVTMAFAFVSTALSVPAGAQPNCERDAEVSGPVVHGPRLPNSPGTGNTTLIQAPRFLPGRAAANYARAAILTMPPI